MRKQRIIIKAEQKKRKRKSEVISNNEEKKKEKNCLLTIEVMQDDIQACMRIQVQECAYDTERCEQIKRNRQKKRGSVYLRSTIK